jgi:S1-C subfamily serine protease
MTLVGVVVSEVDPRSPAARSGLRQGDVITTVDRKPVGSMSDLRGVDLGKADHVLLRVWRQGSFTFVVLRQ